MCRGMAFKPGGNKVQLVRRAYMPTIHLYVLKCSVSAHKFNTAMLPSHDDVIKWKHFPRHWPFVREVHRSPVNFQHKGQWRGALMFYFDLRPNERLSKQPRGWWFETLSSPLWRHRDVLKMEALFLPWFCFIYFEFKAKSLISSCESAQRRGSHDFLCFCINTLTPSDAFMHCWFMSSLV